MDEILAVGMQVIHVPSHAEGNIDHCEQGFVTSVCPGFAFCRYFHRHDPSQLRTVANSERTPVCALIMKETRPQEEIDELLEQLGY